MMALHLKNLTNFGTLMYPKEMSDEDELLSCGGFGFMWNSFKYKCADHLIWNISSLFPQALLSLHKCTCAHVFLPPQYTKCHTFIQLARC